MTVLVTGAKGLIGSQLVKALIESGNAVVGVDLTDDDTIAENYCYYNADLADCKRLREIADSNEVDRFIHLAALAHTINETDLSWERYKHINVDCAKNVFEVAGDHPVLFISTVDVFGFYDGKKPVDENSPIKPISKYGKSKAMAENECRKLKHFNIFRFSPVYTQEIKRDIQKRYYLKYPQIAYQVGRGTYYEVLNIEGAVAAMVGWCSEEPSNSIRIIKDDKMLWTPDQIKAEKAERRARLVIHFPQWMVNCGYAVIKSLLGENEKTYLINKAVHPLRSD